MHNAAFSILDEIDRRKADIDALRPLDPEVEQRVLDRLRLEWNFNSNAIEGNTLSLGETKIFLLEGLTAKGKPLKDHLDIKGHDEAIDFLLRFVRDQETFTEKDIRAFHEVLLKEPYEMDSMRPDGKIVKRQIELGRYKTMPNHVRTSTGKIHYYATPEETPARMQELMDWYVREANKSELHPVLLSTLFHHRFTEIHPFDDGNGRMARILSNLILMQHGYPPVVVRQAKRDAYLYALRQADEGEYESLVEFLGAELLNSMDLYFRAARGEDISSLGDFDKKLALLTQQIESLEKETPPAKDLSSQVNLFNSLIKPLFDKLHRRYEKIDRHFKTIESSFEARGADGGPVAEPRGYLPAIENRLSNHDITELKILDTWKGFRLNTMMILSCMVKITLAPHGFDLSYYVIGKERSPIVLVKERYDRIIVSEQIDEFAIVILNGLNEALEQLIEQRIPND